MSPVRTAPEFYELFLRFNRKLVGILRFLKPTLSVTSSHILAFLRDRPESTARDLVAAIGLEKSTVSRCLSELLARQFITESISDADRRKKFLIPTAEGISALTADQMLRNKEATLAVKELDQSAQDFLCEALQRMADNYQEPSIDAHPSDHPIEQQIRRLTRAMGFVGPSCLGTGLAVEDCQVLQLLHGPSEITSLKLLQSLLPYDLTVSSRLVSDLAQRAYIKKTSAKSDSRAVEIQLTASGRKAADTARTKGQAFIDSGLRGFTGKEREQLASTLQVFLPADAALQTQKHNSFTIDEINTDHERQTLRGLYVAEAVRRHSHFALPESLFAASSRSFLASLSGHPAAILEIPNKSTNAARILILPGDFSPHKLLKDFLAGIIHTYQVRSFTLSTQSLPEHIRRIAGPDDRPTITVDCGFVDALEAAPAPE